MIDSSTEVTCMTGISLIKAVYFPQCEVEGGTGIPPVCKSLVSRRWSSARHTTIQWTEGSTSTSSKVCPTLNWRPTSGFKSTTWIALSGPKRWLPPAPPPHWRRRSRSLRAGSLVWVPRTGEARKSELTFPRSILLTSSRLRLPVQTSEPLHSCAEPNSIRFDFGAILERRLIQTAYLRQT